MSDSDFDPGSDSDLDDDDNNSPPPTNNKKKRKNSKKKQFSESDSANDSPEPKKRRSPRNSKTKKPEPMVLDLDSSDSEEETQPIIINKPKTKRNSKQNETTSTTTNNSKKRRNSSKSNKENEPQHANDADDESYSPKPKKRGRKRKSDEADLKDPPPKKQRTSTSSNSSSTKKSKKTANKKPARKSKSNKNEATERIKQFMLEQNRPFSVSALKNEFVQNPIGQAQIKKSLNELKDDGILVMREFGKKGKTQIYWRNQETFDDEDGDDDEEMMQQRMQELEEEIKRKKSEMIKIKNECLKLQREPTDREMGDKMNMLTTKFNETNKKLEEYENGDTPRVSQDVLNEKLIAFHPFGKAWKERREVLYEMISQVFQESKDKPDKILSKTLRGETDKENDVNWDDYKKIYKKSCTLVQQQRDAAQRNKKRRK